MNRRTLRWVAAVAIVVVLVLPGFSVASPAPRGVPMATSPPSTMHPSETSDNRVAGEARPAPPATELSGSSPPLGSAGLAEGALRADAEYNVPAYDAFVPRPSATAAQILAAQAQGYVTPLFAQSGPAPVGIADFGLSAGTGGRVVPGYVNTTGLEGYFQSNTSALDPLYLTGAAPDGMSIVLGGTSVDVNLFGNDSYSFWFENVAEYFAATHRLVFVANLWNFSSGVMPPSTFYSLGGASEVGESYVEATYDVPFTLNGSFELSLWINSTLVGGRDTFGFTASVSDHLNRQVVSLDTVEFNSTGAGAAAELTAQGYRFNPVGLTDDFELDLGGPGSGTQTNFFNAGGILRLDFWNASSQNYSTVPSAFSYGGDAAETASGVSEGWMDSLAGNETTLAEGPSLARGLWNADGTVGLDPINVSLSIPNAFLFFAPEVAGSLFAQSTAIWAPDQVTVHFAMPPGLYNLTALMAESDPTVISGISIPLSGSAIVPVDFTSNTSMGIYTPLWAWGDSNLVGISSSGDGTPTDPYRIMNTGPVDLRSLFGQYNDLSFPIFAGVFLVDTRDSVLLDRMPALTVRSPYSDTPAENDLAIQFDNTSGVALVNSSHLGGWYTDLLTGEYPRWATDIVVLWNSTGDLVANDTFGVEAGGLYAYGGGSNTIWGNTFTMAPIPFFPDGTLTGLNLSVGVEEGESGDLVYNNAFDTTVTAVTPVGDLYNGSFFVPIDRWNITNQSASVSNPAPGFPNLNLSGSILGTSWQGGNYWWDYGTPTNPFGLLPYDEGGDIATGGDYHPLRVGPLAPVNLVEAGMPNGTPWGVEVYNDTTGLLLDTIDLTGPNATVLLPENGTYAAVGSSGSLGAALDFRVTGPANFTLAFETTYPTLFEETGLPVGTTWGVDVDYRTLRGSGSGLSIDLVNGTWSYRVRSPAGYFGTPSNGVVSVAGGSGPTPVSFAPVLYPISFAASGLTSGALWYLTIDGMTLNGTAPSSLVVDLANGTYLASESAPGYTASPASELVEVAGTPANVTLEFVPLPTYLVQFDEAGLAGGTDWSVTVVGVATHTSATAAVDFQLPNDTVPYFWEANAVLGYVPSPTNGSFPAGVALTITVTFAPVPTFNVSFTEAGLPTGTTWGVNLSGPIYTSTGSAVDLNLPAGPYRYSLLTVSGFSGNPNGGKFAVTNASIAFHLQFTPVTHGVYTVTFTETGLGSGTSWTLIFNDTPRTSSSSTITLTATNGSYSWQVPPFAPYVAAPSSGTLNVSGLDTAVSVVFSVAPPGSYAVTFTESGLAIGTPWSVTLGAEHADSDGTTIVFVERNGSLPFAVNLVAGYTLAVSTGTVNVQGAPQAISVLFLSVPPPDYFLGISYLEWGIVVLSILALTVLLVALLLHRARRPPSAKPPPSYAPVSGPPNLAPGSGRPANPPTPPNAPPSRPA